MELAELILDKVNLKTNLIIVNQAISEYMEAFKNIKVSIYHFWSPWLIVARVLAMLPLYYFVYKKDSLKLAIIIHYLANFSDVVALIPLL